jgi:hypothetical protein
MSRVRRLSFVEILMCGAIVIASAGVVVPALAVRDLDAARIKVESDLDAIASGIERYVADTRTFPTGPEGSTSVHFLFTDGIRPRNNSFASGPGLHLSEFLASDALGGRSWNGPYLDHAIGPDPWGNAYVVNVNGFFSSAERAMVICAGPNGQLNTPPSATTAGGDDFMLLID